METEVKVRSKTVVLDGLEYEFVWRDGYTNRKGKWVPVGYWCYETSLSDWQKAPQCEPQPVKIAPVRAVPCSEFEYSGDITLAPKRKKARKNVNENTKGYDGRCLLGAMRQTGEVYISSAKPFLDVIKRCPVCGKHVITGRREVRCLDSQCRWRNPPLTGTESGEWQDSQWVSFNPADFKKTNVVSSASLPSFLWRQIWVDWFVLDGVVYETNNPVLPSKPEPLSPPPAITNSELYRVMLIPPLPFGKPKTATKQAALQEKKRAAQQASKDLFDKWEKTLRQSLTRTERGLESVEGAADSREHCQFCGHGVFNKKMRCRECHNKHSYKNSRVKRQKDEDRPTFYQFDPMLTSEYEPAEGTEHIPEERAERIAREDYEGCQTGDSKQGSKQRPLLTPNQFIQGLQISWNGFDKMVREHGLEKAIKVGTVKAKKKISKSRLKLLGTYRIVCDSWLARDVLDPSVGLGTVKQLGSERAVDERANRFYQTCLYAERLITDTEAIGTAESVV